MRKIQITENPQLVDKIIAQLQDILEKDITWLDNIFGRAERLVKLSPDGKRIYTPNIYRGQNEYTSILPDSNLGNFCFFQVSDPQQVDQDIHQPGTLTYNIAVIFWMDLRKVNAVGDIRNTEAIKAEILKCLNSLLLQHGHLKINRIYEQAENVWRGYSLDEVDNQFQMHPFAGMRFEATLKVEEDCYA